MDNKILLYILVILCLLLPSPAMFLYNAFHKPKQIPDKPVKPEQVKQEKPKREYPTPYRAEDVATFIIDYASQEYLSSVTNWKLNCILYILQGIYLANGKELFTNEIKTSCIGPIVDGVYEKYTQNGSLGIVTFQKHDVPINDEDKERIMDKVKKYCLVNDLKLIHKIEEQMPYANHYDLNKTHVGYNEIIPKKELGYYFRKYILVPDAESEQETYQSPYNVWEISDYIIQKTNESGHVISLFKLVYILYFAQGIYMQIFDKPLFDEDFELWMSGVMLQSVWRRFRKFGNNSILLSKYECKLNEDDESFLDGVMNCFGSFSSTALAKIIDNQSVIAEAREKVKKNPNSVIDKEAIKKAFGQYDDFKKSEA